MLQSIHSLILHQKVKFSLRRLTKVLFLGSLILCLCLGNLHSGSWQFSVGAVAIANPIAQTVQQGIDSYNKGDLPAAINKWQQALTYAQESGRESQNTIRKYLVRAYQQLGQTEEAIATLDQIISTYRGNGDRLSMGRMLSEQAQVYSSIGQHRRAIALLCGKSKAQEAGEQGSRGAGERGRAESRPVFPSGGSPPLLKSSGSSGVSPAVKTPRLFAGGELFKTVGDGESGKISPPHSLTPSPPPLLATRHSDTATTFDCDKDSALEIARQQSDQVGVAAALGSLGNAYRLQGEYNRATDYLEASLDIAGKISNPSLLLAALNGLGNVYTSLANRNLRYAYEAYVEGDEKQERIFRHNASSYDQKALEYFQEMGNLAHRQNDKTARVRSLLNTLVPLHRNPNLVSKATVTNTIKQALLTLENIPDSQDKVYYTIKIADFLPPHRIDSTHFDTNFVNQCPKSESPQAVELLNKAVAIAQRIQDPRSQSFALGRLAHIYECRKDYEQALSLTQQAQLVALTPDSLYQWEWQAGRILKAQGRKRDAIKAYESAVKTLKSIRSDITLANRDLQLDFRDTVEPVYRQLAQLWLDSTLTNSNPNSNDYPQEYLEPALAAIDDLRLAELQNYLGDECELPVIEKPVALLDRNTAVFNSIILKQGIAIVLTLPAGENKFNSQIYWIPADSTQVIKLINDFRLKLEKRSDRANSYKQSARQLYNWIIRPYESDLAAAKIKTLVFIQDGILRSIPMAALDDGKQFLIQKYAIAYTPSLAVTIPTPLEATEFRVLAFGLTEKSVVDNQTSFPPLSNVKAEIESIQTILPGSKGFLDQTFTRDRLQQELENNTYPLLHLATHGKFGIDSSQTFLVTGNVVTNNNQNAADNHYNETLTMNELYQLVKSTKGANQIKLLTLSACETAAGSERDALGIAGIALQAGVQSALASLWQVDDQATTKLITEFYQSLREGLSKAEALQATQKAWLEAHPKGRYNHPAYWSPFILTGNWL